MSVSVNDTAIKRILSNEKFVPLHVEYNGEFRQAKLYDVSCFIGNNTTLTI